MATDPVRLDVIETQKENIQSLPGGRSAKELARIFSPAGRDSCLIPNPSPNETKTINDSIRQEYETELQSADESDDPLDIYDRYVRWTLHAYPSAQATPDSGLLPLLERATKVFLSSPLYKNDPRYLRLWLHYIRLFSDSPREVFAFLARHHVGEALALFYEEFAAWLESAGRWAQADEVYMLGVDNQARPAERLLRKYGEFQRRYGQKQTQDVGPSSPALRAVRPALAAKVDPFATSTDRQASSAQQASSRGEYPRSRKPKMAVFSDDADTAQPAVTSDQRKGWESIGSMADRTKENTDEPRPWVGETLHVGKRTAGPTQKMAVFRDQVSRFFAPSLLFLPSISAPCAHPLSDVLLGTILFYDYRTNVFGVIAILLFCFLCIQSNAIQSNEAILQQSNGTPAERRVREATNPRTGRIERVFVDLEAVYPDFYNCNHEMSFEELRAIHRGWMHKDWRSLNAPLKRLSPNMQATKLVDHGAPKVAVAIAEGQEKPRKMKVREVKGETQTSKESMRMYCEVFLLTEDPSS